MNDPRRDAGRLRQLHLALRGVKGAESSFTHEQRVPQGPLREAARLDAEAGFQGARLVGQGDRELELAPDPRAVGPDSREQRREGVVEHALRPARGIRPGEEFVAHGPHGELPCRR